MKVKLLISLFSFLLLLVACSEQQSHTAPAVHDRDSASMMTSYGVNTLISDSGVIKYRIVTERWDVNTIKNPPRWTFEKGIFMEQFDQQFHIEGYIQADSAWYYDQQKLWELRGRVYIRNVNGLIFRSEELFWDGIKHEFYSHKFSRVVTPEQVTNSVGSFQAADMEPEPAQPATPVQPAAGGAPVKPDTAKVEVPVRKAATRHKATQKPDFRP